MSVFIAPVHMYTCPEPANGYLCPESANGQRISFRQYLQFVAADRLQWEQA
jgi:hypothetical protein